MNEKQNFTNFLFFVKLYFGQNQIAAKNQQWFWPNEVYEKQIFVLLKCSFSLNIHTNIYYTNPLMI